MDNLCCYSVSEGLFFLKRGTRVGLSAINSQEKPVFSLISVPENILKHFCSCFSEMFSENVTSVTTKEEWIIKSAPLTSGHDILQKLEMITSTQSKAPVPYSAVSISCFFYILSHFIYHGKIPHIIKSASETSFMEKIYNIITSNIEVSWTLDIMAKRLFISSSSLKRKLKVENTTFSAIYLTARMNIAAKLLRQKEFSVQKVAMMCGYSSCSYFITVFKQYFRITPKEYISLFG
ncbi:TPA: helix-turn-helix domain-containing protein [Escherichia coli]|nr:helix-turn-helix domain-containing protein [Escherichia coli]